MRASKFGLNFALPIALGVLLAGCGGESPKPLYYWDVGYSASLYEYFTEEGDVHEQIGRLENSVQKAHEEGASVPPGLYAHLGLLYSNLGNTSRANSYFEKEVQAFPEARAYIAFLLSQKSKGTQNLRQKDTNATKQGRQK